MRPLEKGDEEKKYRDEIKIQETDLFSMGNATHREVVERELEQGISRLQQVARDRMEQQAQLERRRREREEVSC